MLIKILIAGNGGQGVQTSAKILAQAVFQSGRHASFIPNYGLEQRGGMSLAYLQISDEEIAYPRFAKPDILVMISEEVKERVKQYIFSDIQIWDIKKMPHAEAGRPNMFFLGRLTKILSEKKILSAEQVRAGILAKLGQKSGLEENLKAFEAGLSFTE